MTVSELERRVSVEEEQEWNEFFQMEAEEREAELKKMKAEAKRR
jgi:hypothetical protein